MNDLIFYADGSASPNPGPGGWAVVRDRQPVALGGEPDTTNIRMEGMALIAALQLAGERPCVIRTDSQFWIDVVTKSAKGWEVRGWTRKDGPIANPDLVKEAHPLYKASNAKLEWIRGHNGDPGNESADEWANRARQGERLGPPAAPGDAAPRSDGQAVDTPPGPSTPRRRRRKAHRSADLGPKGFRARFPGICGVCHGRIVPLQDDIVYTDGVTEHAVCAVDRQARDELGLEPDLP